MEAYKFYSKFCLPYRERFTFQKLAWFSEKQIHENIRKHWIHSFCLKLCNECLGQNPCCYFHTPGLPISEAPRGRK
jgi:hypothetical protein